MLTATEFEQHKLDPTCFLKEIEVPQVRRAGLALYSPGKRRHAKGTPVGASLDDAGDAGWGQVAWRDEWLGPVIF
ncbi:MAG TPA: hypothetical protein VFD30_11860 [Terriglobia bacterium]|nr:hypothetical protein [Terriglobia bacterium]